MTKELIQHLSQFVTDHRLQLFDRVLSHRTRYLTVVLEDIYQPHNASAVLRSCECFGLQDVHIIENNNQYQINPDITLGSNKWLSLFRYNEELFNTPQALKSLKSQGYRIVATTPHKNDRNLEDFDLSKGKSALVFGSELNGLTHHALEMADEFLKIPMAGFTESLNISVTAAICMHHLSNRLRDSNISWQLSDTEKDEIKLNWLKNSVRNSDLIVKTFISNNLKNTKNTR